MVPADDVTLLQMMRHGFTISRLITNQPTQAGLLKVSHQPLTVVRRGELEPKALFSILFKSNGPVLIHAVDKDKTVDHNYCIENCLKSVVKEIRKQRKSSGTKGIKLLQDNTRPHTHSDVIHYLTKEDIIIMLHPSYSSDLVPGDYWLNDVIKGNQPNEKLLARVVSKAV